MQRYGSGATLIVLGLALAWKSLDYRIGALARMGPGFFPLMLGISLAVIGLLIIVLPEHRPVLRTGAEEADRPVALRKKLRPWFGIVLAFAAFVVLGRHGGLIPATFATVLIAALADRNNTIPTALGLASAVTVLAVIVFHYLIHLPLPLLARG